MCKHSKRKNSIIVIVLITCVIWSALWLINYRNYNIPNSSYEKLLNSLYARSEEEYVFSVSRPVFPSFVGNFAVSSKSGSQMIIWLAPFSINLNRCEIGIRTEINGIMYNFYVDTEMNYVRHKKIDYSSCEEDKIQFCTKAHREEYMNMLQKACDEWMLVKEKSGSR